MPTNKLDEAIRNSFHLPINLLCLNPIVREGSNKLCHLVFYDGEMNIKYVLLFSQPCKIPKCHKYWFLKLLLANK